MTRRTCPATLTGEHMFTPKHITNQSPVTAPGVWLTDEFQCRCGAFPPDKAVVRAALQSTARERKRQADAAKRLLGQAQMESTDSPRLPGFD